jgi:uncharacterized SAM-binding protein YcdF (DUF218 family)
MFFILSKVLYLFIQPMNWVIGMMIYALFVKQPAHKRKALLGAVLLTLFFTNHLIFNQVAKWWEVETITANQISQPFDIGIVLGGYSNTHILPRHDRHNFSQRGNRFFNAYELYKTGKVKKLLLTGGSGDLLQKQASEAVLMKGFLTRIGIPEGDILVEADSRNTYENAVFTKKVLDTQYPGASCLLITSAYHMRRSMGCYKNAGVAFTPFSVDFLTEKDRWAPENTLIPDRNGFYWWETLIKEWVGCVMYWLKGYV